MFTWQPDPVMFDLGFIQIRYYGFFFAFGLFLAYMLAKHMCKVKKLSLETLENLFVYLFVGMLLGARLGHILFYELDFYLERPAEIIKIWNGGLASHGAAIGMLIAYGIFLWRKKMWKKPFAYADIVAVAAAIPAGFIRLGNFFNSELVGKATNGEWGVVFSYFDATPRHPSQLYEFGMGIFILGVLYFLWEKKHDKVWPGFFLGLFMLMYFGMRFLVEFAKNFPAEFAGMTTGQLLSIPFFLAGFIVLLYKQPKKK